MSRLTASLALIATGAAFAACSGPLLPYQKDPLAVIERYPHRMTQETCPVWLTSHITGYRYCASPKIDLAQGAPVPAGPVAVVAGAGAAAAATTAPSFSKSEGATDLESLRAHGEGVYANVCTACHGPAGAGVPGAFPPLAGSGGFYGTPQNHAKIIVHGLSGPITVQGLEFNGAMPPQGAGLTDYDIAAVATYERTSWGNADGIVLPADVAAVR